MFQQIAALVVVLGALFGVYRHFDGRLSELENVMLFPAGTMLPYSSRDGQPPDGWVFCGQENTPNLNGRFLLATDSLALAGESVGSIDLSNPSVFTSGYDIGPPQSEPVDHNVTEGADNWIAPENNWRHQHTVELPSYFVRYFCKV